MECGKIFSSKSNLNRHAQVHEGRTFVCVVCGKSCSQKQSLASHLKRAHRADVVSAEQNPKQDIDICNLTVYHILELSKNMSMYLVIINDHWNARLECILHFSLIDSQTISKARGVESYTMMK